MKVCKECSQEFKPKNTKAIFCSPQCRQKDYRKKVAILLTEARGSGGLDAHIKKYEDGALVIKTSELSKIPNPQVLLTIQDCKDELLTLGQGQFANQRRKFLEKKIKELQNKL
jgi:hypothetical protein